MVPPQLPRPQRGAPEPAAAERRLVSVLFADLVGFTTLPPKARDAEEMRELLSRYFETARTRDRALRRHGREVHRRRVMAVWGAPVAQEDDAERAVRAALDLVAAVPGARPGRSRARAGVLTGEAAVTLGAEGQGMVAGDLVNTASRDPVGGRARHGARRRGDEARDRGRDRLRGGRRARAEGEGGAGAALARAARRSRAGGGSMRSAGLEAPFVGRDRELRLVKELFHASAEEGGPSSSRSPGSPGIGKSRLAWEFEKYIDGLVDDAFWHRGRCLSYGEGVAYWALAEMVRMRCGIARGRGCRRRRARSCARRSRSTSPTRRSARWVEPRLAHLLGLEEGAPATGEPVLRLADPLRAARRAGPDGARLRGHAVGRRGPARLPRVPARVVAQPPALRVRARPARARRQALRPGARQAQLHVALPRAAARRRR